RTLYPLSLHDALPISFFNVMALSPVVPLGDGTWCPTVPPWTEATGLRALYLKPEAFWSHGTVTVSDAMLGPLYLVFCEVLDADEDRKSTRLNSSHVKI